MAKYESISGDVVKASDNVESRSNQKLIDYFPLSNVTKPTMKDNQGNTFLVKAGMLGFVSRPFMEQDQEYCLVDFTQYGTFKEDDTVITVILPTTLLKLETRFQIGDLVLAKPLVESRLDLISYAPQSNTPGETKLALLKAGLEAVVLSPGFILELDFTILLKGEALESLKGKNISLSAGGGLLIYISLPPTLVELHETFASAIPAELSQDIKDLGYSIEF